MPCKTDVVVAHTIGIDTGKNTLYMVGLDEKGAIVLREKISRSRIAARLANVPQCLIGIEAGMASHYVARELLALGHEVKQVPPAYAIPFRQGHKNDFRDAHAVAEAVERPSTRCVPTKTEIRFAGTTSCKVSIDRQSHGCDQSDSRLSPGARRSRPARASLFTTAAATDSSYTCRCAVAPYHQDHCGPHR
jgi:hypothetical protein